MNTRDVVTTAAVLITGILVGYLLGRNSTLTAPEPSPNSAEPAAAVPAPIAVVPVLPTPSPEKPTSVQKAPKTAPPPSRPTPPDRRVVSPFSLADIPLMGDPSTAKVAITVFSDFQ